MTALAPATAGPAPGPARPLLLKRSQRRWQHYGDLKRRDTVAPAAPPAGEPPAPPPKKKGKRPTHELVRVIQADGHKAYQPVAVIWLRENGKGFVKLNADLKAGDDLVIAPIKFGGAS